MEGVIAVERVLIAAGMAGARVSGLLLVAPFFSSALMPLRIRLGLALLLTGVMLPLVGPVPDHIDMASWVHLLVSESLVGFLLGLPLQLLFEAAQFAGQVLGIQVGLSLVSILDPQSNIDTPVLSLFHQMIFLLLLLAMDVPEWMLRGMASSFAYVPAGTARLSGALTGSLLHGVSAIFLAGIQIAAPVMLVTILTDVSLGLLGKVSPQLPVLWIGVSLKSVVGLLVLASSLVVWPGVLEGQFGRALRLGEEWLRLAH